jgi:hypothetical protein
MKENNRNLNFELNLFFSRAVLGITFILKLNCYSTFDNVINESLAQSRDDSESLKISRTERATIHFLSPFPVFSPASDGHNRHDMAGICGEVQNNKIIRLPKK